MRNEENHRHGEAYQLRLLLRPYATATDFSDHRQLSYPLTHILYYLPISPNQITALSMAAGWPALVFYAGCTKCIPRERALAHRLLYARQLRRRDRPPEGNDVGVGAHFDDFVDWLVDSAFFAALGYGVWQDDG